VALGIVPFGSLAELARVCLKVARKKCAKSNFETPQQPTTKKAPNF
jgi:hypothetical protein